MWWSIARMRGIAWWLVIPSGRPTHSGERLEGSFELEVESKFEAKV
jgi:hypothetical protein